MSSTLSTPASPSNDVDSIQEVNRLAIQETKKSVAQDIVMTSAFNDLAYTESHFAALQHHLSDGRSLPIIVKGHLPPPHAVKDENLKMMINSVMEESDSYGMFVTDFVNLILSGADQLNYLFDMVLNLKTQVTRSVERVNLDKTAWAPEDLKVPLDAVENQLSAIERFMEQDVTEYFGKLRQQRAVKITTLSNMINGTRQLSQGLKSTLQEEEQRVIDGQFELLELKSEVKRTKAEQLRAEANMKTAEIQLADCASRQEYLERQKAEISQQSEEHLVEYLQRVAADESDFPENPETEGMLRDMQKKVSLAFKECSESEIRTAVDWNEIPKTHLVVMLPQSNSPLVAQVRGCIHTLGENRAAQRPADLVSVVSYHKQSTPSHFRSSWTTVCADPNMSEVPDPTIWENLKQLVGYGKTTHVDAAWTGAHEIISPAHSAKEDAVFLFVGVPTESGLSDDELADAVATAGKINTEARKRGACKAYFLMLSETRAHGAALEIKLQELVKAANGGETEMPSPDEESESQKFYNVASTTKEVDKCFDELLYRMNPSIKRTRIKHQIGNDKIEQALQLEKRAWANLEARRKSMLDSAAQMAKRDGQRFKDKKEMLSHRAEEMDKHYDELIEKCKSDHGRLSTYVGSITDDMEDRELDIGKLEKTIEVKEQSFATSATLGTDASSTVADLQRNKAELRAKCGGDTETLGTVLTDAMLHMEDTQVLFRTVLESFNSAARPVKTLVQSLSLNSKRTLDTVAAVFKIMEYYKKTTDLPLKLSGADRPADWAMIVSFVCGSTSEDAKIFTDIMHVEDFSFSYSSLSITARDEKMTELETKFNVGLASHFEDLQELKREREEAEEEEGAAKKRRKTLEQECGTCSADDKKEVQMNLKEVTKELQGAGNRVRTAESKYRKELCKPATMKLRGMVRQVCVAISAVYESVRLQVGMGDAEHGLAHLVDVFEKHVRRFNNQVRMLASNFLRAGVSANTDRFINRRTPEEAQEAIKGAQETLKRLSMMSRKQLMLTGGR